MLHLLLAFGLALAPARQDPAAPATEASTPADPGEQLVADLQSAFEEGDVSDLEACVDVDALLEKGTSGIDADETFRKSFMGGVRSTLLSSFHSSVRKALENGGSLHFLRIRKVRGQQRLLFRLLIPNAGVNYVDFSTHVCADKALRADDWYPYTSGEWVSETLHHLYLPFAMQRQRGLLDRLIGKDQVLVRNWGAFSKLLECAEKGDLEHGLEVYRSMPEELRHDKVVLLQRLRLLSGHTDNEDYLHLLEDLRRYCAGDPANELHAIDYHYLRKEWRRAAEAVRRLRDTLEGDAYLDSLESTVLALAGDLPAAREAAERAVEGEPELLQAHWQLVSICLGQKDFDAVLAELEKMDGLFELKWNDLTQTEEYKEFAASPQHAQWLAYLESKAKK